MQKSYIVNYKYGIAQKQLLKQKYKIHICFLSNSIFA